MNPPFTWSYSKLKDWELCPRRWHAKYVLKRKEAETPQMLDGKVVHKAMELRCAHGTPLPPHMAKYERYGKIVDAARGRGMQVHVEQRIGLTRDLTPTGFFDGDVYCRIIMDAVLVGETVALVIDWKTGRMKYEDATQLQLFAGAAFALYPHVNKVLSKYVWLVEEQESPENYERDKMQEQVWKPLLPRVAKMEAAIENDEFVPRSSWACGNCIATECEYRKART